LIYYLIHLLLQKDEHCWSYRRSITCGVVFLFVFVASQQQPTKLQAATDEWILTLSETNNTDESIRAIIMGAQITFDHGMDSNVDDTTRLMLVRQQSKKKMIIMIVVSSIQHWIRYYTNRNGILLLTIYMITF
jgi:hypothetical protein